MKYTLYIFDKDPKYGIQIIKCENSTEAVEYKRKAQKMGFEVRVKGEKNEERRLDRV